MEVTLHGAAGVSVPSHVTGDTSVVHGLAAIPREQMKEKIVKDPRIKHGNVTQIPAKVQISFIQSPVNAFIFEISSAILPAVIHLL